MKTKRKPYTKSVRWKEAVKDRTNWSKMMMIVQLEKELGDVQLVSDKIGLSTQRVYSILKRAREVLPDYKG